MNIMFSAFTAPTSTLGAVTRMMALAKKFTREGHTVNFCAFGDTIGQLRDKGFTVHEMPEPTIFGLPKVISDMLANYSYKAKLPTKEGKSYGNLWQFLFFTGHSSRRYLLECVRRQKEACEELGADLIITELDPSGYICAHLLNIPIAATYATVAKKDENSYFWKRTENIVNYVLKHFNNSSWISLHDIIYGKKVFKLIPSIPELEDAPQNESTCYCGNMLETVRKSSVNFQPEPDKKYIFCYFGTGSISLDTVEKQLPRALKGRNDIICYMASNSIRREYSIDNVRFVNFINAHALLPHCILTICHGGLNSITQSLEYGVPVLSFPGPIFERRYNSEILQERGVGYMGELSDFNAEWIRTHLDSSQILSANLNHIQQRFKEYNGVDTAYNSICNWVESIRETQLL